MRRFIFDLRPASLTDAGLLPTLRQYTREYSEQFNVPVELNLPENLVLSANQELVVFRVVQEALQNVHRHAEATEIVVEILQRPGGPAAMNHRTTGRAPAKASRPCWLAPNPPSTSPGPAPGYAMRWRTSAPFRNLF